MRVGVFLPPGAARAAYQVGALQALVEDGGLRFDVVGASSVGALNGGFAATGQVGALAELWSRWRDRDILGVDWGALARGAVLWAPNLMHNRPQKTGVIDRHLGDESRLLPGVRFRFNLADLTHGRQEVFEWPGAPWPLAEGVNASVAVPAAIRPVEALGRQWADGLTIDGFPLEEVALATGLDRVFVLGVAPRTPDDRPCRTAYAVLLRALEHNQFSETRTGLERSEAANARIRAWEDARAAVDRALEAIPDATLRADLLTEARAIHDRAGFPYARAAVEIVPVLPERHTPMFFTSYSPERSRALLAQGREDARRVLAEISPTDAAGSERIGGEER